MLAHLKYSKKVFTRTVRIRLLENGIVHYTFLPEMEVDENDHLENHKALVEITGNVKHPLLIDSGEEISITPEARKKIRELETIVPVTARAIIVKSLSHRMLTNFYMRFHQPIVTTKIFEDYDEALQFLLTTASNK